MKPTEFSLSKPRIVSLIASSTETLCALGLEEFLMGRSHECDYPDWVARLPACSEPKFDIEGDSGTIDQRVRNVLKNALSVYRVDVDRLKSLAPTLIVTQDHCEVCAVSLKDVEQAACEILPSKPTLVSLAPNTLDDIFDGFREIARAVGAPERGDRMVRDLKTRMAAVQKKTVHIEKRKSVVCVEWIEPLMAASNWMPGLVEMAGGRELLGIKGGHSPRLAFESLVEKDPEYIIVMPCGWGIPKVRSELRHLTARPEWNSLSAVKSGNVYLTDGNQFFNRPGPRIAESLDILAEILHPDLFPPALQGKGWVRFQV